jgi:hypothetical protein
MILDVNIIFEQGKVINLITDRGAKVSLNTKEDQGPANKKVLNYIKKNKNKILTPLQANITF